MTTLDTLQRVFQDYLLHEENHHIENLTREGYSLPKSEQLQIYFNAYRLRLIEILASDYPKLKILIGEEKFDECAIDYITQFPSHHFSVRCFGQQFSLFLKNTKPYSESSDLAELAAFEWALSNTLDAPDAPLLAVEALKTIAPDAWGFLQFTFHPSLQIINCEWDTPQRWDALRTVSEQSIESSISSLKPIDLAPIKQAEPITWIVWRNILQSQYRSLNSIQTFMLHLLLAGKTFAELCEAMCEKIEESLVPETALGFIQQCIQDNLIKL